MNGDEPRWQSATHAVHAGDTKCPSRHATLLAWPVTGRSTYLTRSRTCDLPRSARMHRIASSCPRQRMLSANSSASSQLHHGESRYSTGIRYSWLVRAVFPVPSDSVALLPSEPMAGVTGFGQQDLADRSALGVARALRASIAIGGDSVCRLRPLRSVDRRLACVSSAEDDLRSVVRLYRLRCSSCCSTHEVDRVSTSVRYQADGIMP